jgi:hypothetical protein
MDGCMARRLGFFLSHEERMRQTKLPKSWSWISASRTEKKQISVV